MIKAVLFDLDGTLLPLDEEEFTKAYFSLLCKRFCPLGFDKDELIKVIWLGTKEMIKNNGKVTNDVIFWDTFAKHFGEEKAKLKSSFDTFYDNEYLDTKNCVKPNPYARQILDFLKEVNVKAVLASRPVFPKNGMINRAGFVGIKEDDFCLVTSYDFSSYCKPNAKYYEQILQHLNLAPTEVLMFGNNEEEDGVATDIGIKTYLVDNGYIIKGEKERNLPVIQLKDVIPTIKKELNI